jgi:hypothetical protein
MPNRSFTDEEFIIAVKNNKTIKAVLESLNLRAAGSNYKTVHKYVAKLNLDTSHWNRYANHHIGRTKIPIEEILIENSSFSRVHLKNRLIKNSMLSEECSMCGILHWHGQKLSLQLDHINGVWNDNRIENLRLLCPNCHSLTKDFAGKSLRGKNHPESKTKRILNNKCIDCSKAISPKSTRCQSCAGKNIKKTVIDWPPVAVVIKMVSNSSYLAAGRKLGVSDNAIRKYIKRSSNPL